MVDLIFIFYFPSFCFPPTIYNLTTLLPLVLKSNPSLHISLSLTISLSQNQSLDIKMENNLPVISKKVLSLVRVTFFMLRKGVSKGKLRMNLHMILKRHTKLAGKAIANLISHYPHHGGSTSNCHSHDSHSQFTSSREYEFSCSNTHSHFFSIGKRHHSHKHNAQAPPTHDDEVTTMNAMKAVLEMLNNDQAIVETSPGFPLRDDDEKDNEVDKAAEDFINRFYCQLRMQD